MIDVLFLIMPFSYNVLLYEVTTDVEKLKQGYIVGNSRTDADKDDNEKIPYAHRMGLVSDEYFEVVFISHENNVAI